MGWMNISRSRGRERKLTDRPNSRPKSEYAAWEDPPAEGEPFDYDAEPSRFYFQVESAGNLEPDAIIQEGIKQMGFNLHRQKFELSGLQMSVRKTLIPFNNMIANHVGKAHDSLADNSAFVLNQKRPSEPSSTL